MFKPTYRVPEPQRLRRIQLQHSFAWIDHRLLRGKFLHVMTHQDQSVYLFLALAADRNGVSFYRREKICDILALDFCAFEVARDRLINMGLIAFQPYSAVTVNGFHQVLAVDGQPPDFASMTPAPSPPPKIASRPPCDRPAAKAVARSTAAPAAPPTGSRQASPSSAADLASRLAAAFKAV
jgi:hypothetical protein